MTTKPPKESITQSLDDPLAAHLRAALLALPAEVVEGGSCKVVNLVLQDLVQTPVQASVILPPT